VRHERMKLAVLTAGIDAVRQIGDELPIVWPAAE
jgi:hypothetical protein